MPETLLPAPNYDLAATLTSGQAFRWKPSGPGWQGVIGPRAVYLEQRPSAIWIQTPSPPMGRTGVPPVPLGVSPNGPHSPPPGTTTPSPDWQWATDYLQTNVNLPAILATFPDDPPMRAAVASCPGLRLLRQDPWETLASFILSSTKQIIQIQQIVQALCDCYGNPLPPLGKTGALGTSGSDPVPSGASREENIHSHSTISPSPHSLPIRVNSRPFAVKLPPLPPSPHQPPLQTFPTPARLAALEEQNLRACKMGFRAPYLLKTARLVASGQLDLESLRALPTPAARAALCQLPGVGEKIANCVLLFAYGFQDAFPVDVWIQKAIQQLYFPKRKPSAKRLKHFVQTHFGPNAGYAQQYLFHYMRTRRQPAAPL